MSYVIFNIETTVLLRMPSGGVGCYKTHYATEPAAKAAFTRALKKGKIVDAEWTIAEAGEFHRMIEKREVRRNLMSGKEFSQPVNTPLCCDPSSETYWSM